MVHPLHFCQKNIMFDWPASQQLLIISRWWKPLFANHLGTTSNKYISSRTWWCAMRWCQQNKMLLAAFNRTEKPRRCEVNHEHWVVLASGHSIKQLHQDSPCRFDTSLLYLCWSTWTVVDGQTRYGWLVVLEPVPITWANHILHNKNQQIIVDSSIIIMDLWVGVRKKKLHTCY